MVARLACVWGFEGLNYNSGEPISNSDWPEEAYTWTWIQRYHLTKASSSQLYSVALYVALSNIFGGPTDISPANYIEFLLQGFMMIFGSSLWAYIIGCGCSILASLNPAADEHRRTIAMLNHFWCAQRSRPTPHSHPLARDWFRMGRGQRLGGSCARHRPSLAF